MAFPTESKYINEFESILGLRLPADYKEGLLTSNGAEINIGSDIWQIFPVFDKSDRKRITRTANHILVETKSANGWVGFPVEAVAIASNGYGDFAILLPCAENKESLQDVIYRWNHETGNISVLCPTSAIWFNSRI